MTTLNDEESELFSAMAKARCQENGWPFKEPVGVTKNGKEVVVATNQRRMGGNVIIRFDYSSRAVITENFSPR